MPTFKRRRYRSVGSLLRDLSAILTRAKAALETIHAGRLSASFRERLMLTVTSVNECRYCARFHSAQARLAGLGAFEVSSLLGGTVGGAPPEEVPALLYALHWAERDGLPDEAMREQLFEFYGEHEAKAIELALVLIRSGNLLGNSWDYLLYRLSFGRWGLTPGERAAKRHIV